MTITTKIFNKNCPAAPPISQRTTTNPKQPHPEEAINDKACHSLIYLSFALGLVDTLNPANDRATDIDLQLDNNLKKIGRR